MSVELVDSHCHLDSKAFDGDREEAIRRAVDAGVARMVVIGTGEGPPDLEAGVRLADARLASARAEQQNAALQESYTRIVAPVSGFLSRKQVEVGELVQPGQTLMTIVADTGVWVTANYKETQLNKIRVGQSVAFNVDAYGGRAFHGTVESISAATGAKFSLLPPDNADGQQGQPVGRLLGGGVRDQWRNTPRPCCGRDEAISLAADVDYEPPTLAAFA